MTNQTVQLNEDQKAVVEREIKSAYSALSTLLDWVKKDELSEDMKETLPSLVNSYLATVKEAIGYTGAESEREKEMKESVGQYYQNQIKELKQALENQHSVAGVTAQVKLACDKIDKWWDIEGFQYIREQSITGNGNAIVKFGFMLDTCASSYSETPVSDKKEKQTKVQYLMEKGFQLTPKKNGFDLDVLDNDNNRKLLLHMIKEAFPSATIVNFENHVRRTNDEQENHFILREMKVIIYDLHDIDALHVEEKCFLAEEE